MKIALTVLVLTCSEMMALEPTEARSGGKSTPISPTYVPTAKPACKIQAPKAPLASNSKSNCQTHPRETSVRR